METRMKHRNILLRVLAAAVLGASLGGCVVVPAGPYHYGYGHGGGRYWHDHR